MVESRATRDFEVHIRTYECAQTLSCTCAVAVRENNEAFILDMCDGNTTVFNSPRALLRFAPGSDETQLGSITTSDSGNSYTIRLASGAFVNVYVFSWGMNVLVHILGQDFNTTRGLCGNYNNDVTDDIMIRDTEEIDDSDGFEEFVNSWRIPEGESYFERDPDSVVSISILSAGFCDCSNLASPDQITCGELIDEDSFSIFAGPNRNPVTIFRIVILDVLFGKRRRRDVTSGQNILIDTEYNPLNFNYAENSFNFRNFSWPTESGKTEAEVTSECERVLRGTCDAITTNTNVSSDAVSKCILDVKETDSYDWIYDKIAETQFACLEDAVRAVNLSTGEDDVSITRAQRAALISNALDPVTQNVCPLACNGQGQCVNSMCECESDWTGSDCSIDSTSLPDVSRFLSGDVCDASTSSCDVVQVELTSQVFSSPNLLCRIEILESDETVTNPASLQSAFAVICPLPDPTQLMNDFTTNALTYRISVTRDGLNYGNAASYKIFDGSCLECGTAAIPCTILGSSCSIEGACYQEREVNTASNCDACIPALSQTTWSLNPDNMAATLPGPDTFYKLENESIEIQMQASDPDGDDDSIRYILDTALDGLTLTSHGQLTWSGSSMDDTTVVVTLIDACDVINDVTLSLNIVQCQCEGVNSYCVAADNTAQGHYNCACVTGYTGNDCSENIDDCLNTPCIHGTCHDGVNSYLCICDDGFTGNDCDVNIDDCSSIPCVNGDCVDDVHAYSCECDDGYTGMNCDVNIDECFSNPCVNGDCVDDVAAYSCSCPMYFEGVHCEDDTRAGHWSEWSPYAQCSVTCDLGLQTRSRSCIVEDTCTSGETVESQGCLLTSCPSISDEQDNIAEMEIHETSLTQVAMGHGDIISWVRDSVNHYCDVTSAEQCCLLVRTDASDFGDLRIFTDNNVRFADGSIEETRNSSITLGLVVEVERSRLLEACDVSETGDVAKRAVDMVMMPRDLLEDALRDNMTSLAEAGFNATLVIEQSDEQKDGDDSSLVIVLSVVMGTLLLMFVIGIIVCFVCRIRLHRRHNHASVLDKRRIGIIPASNQKPFHHDRRLIRDYRDYGRAVHRADSYSTRSSSYSNKLFI